MKIASLRLAGILGFALVGCGGGGGSGNPDAAMTIDGPDMADSAIDGPAGGPTARFAPTAEPMAYLSVPYPSDLYRSGAGIKLATLPAGDMLSPATLMMMEGALGADPGFGLTTSLYFGYDGTFTQSEDALAQSIHIVDLETGAALELDAPRAHADLHRIWVHPKVPFKADHSYGAWIDLGSGLQPSASFLSARAETRPTDAILGKAYDMLAPLWSHAMRDQAVVATVFRTHPVRDALTKIKTMIDGIHPPVRSTPAPIVLKTPADLDAAVGVPTGQRPGLDNAGGVIHSNIGYVVHGQFDGPNFLTTTDQAGTSGIFAFDTQGNPMQKGTQPIGFLLTLPRGPFSSSSPLPVVVYQHAMRETRADAYALADAFAAHGIAVFAPDFPFHGDRFVGFRDLRNNITFGTTPDHIPDKQGVVAALRFLAGATTNGVAIGDPRAIRDDLRQFIVDLMAAGRLVKQGDLTALRAADPDFANLAFRTDRIVGVSQGFPTATFLATASFDDVYTALAGSQPSGGLVIPFMSTTPSYATMFIPVVGNLFNVNDELAAHPSNEMAIMNLFQQLVEPGDPLALVAQLPPQHFFWSQAFSDEIASNQSEELIESLMGMPALGGGTFRYHTLTSGTLPAMANLSGRTAGIVQYGSPTVEVSFDFLTHQAGDVEYVPGFPPFMKYEPPHMTANPIEQAQSQLVGFVTSHFTSGTPTISP